MTAKVRQEGRLLRVRPPSGSDEFLVERLTLHEEISEPFSAEVILQSGDRGVRLESVVGKELSVDVHGPGGVARSVSGVVVAFSLLGEDRGVVRYRAELRPSLWLLSLSSGCHVFQESSVPEIVEAVLRDHGIRNFRSKLARSYERREYCVQYQESALDFVSRLMEDEGIYYFFTHESGGHTLVLADDAGEHPSCPSSETVRYGVSESEREMVDVLTEVEIEAQLTPGAYALDDFNFLQPGADLFVRVKGRDARFAGYEYPGGFEKTPAGQKRARRRLEAVEFPGQLMRGEGSCRGFVVGHAFRLRGHPRRDVDGAYVLHTVSTVATQDEHHVTFEAFEKGHPFRPLTTTPRPRISGTQTAVVVGKKGDEIWTDKYGRIKVQFHWDQEGKRDDKSSCWVRVAQPWAGKGWGAQFLPRVGQEVAVSFLSGDPDRPLVTGSVYNGSHKPPFALPSKRATSGIRSQTVEGSGHNEISFDDTKDKEMVLLQAQRDFKEVVGRNHVVEVKEEEKRTIEKGRTSHVKMDDALTVDGARRIEVKKKATHDYGADLMEKVKGDSVLQVDGDLTIKVGGKLKIQAASMTVKASGSITTKAGSSLTNQAGTSLTNQAGTSLTNKANTSLTNQAGTSLTNKSSLTLTNNASVSMTNKGGAMQNVEAGGVLSVKGALLKLN